MVLSLLAAVSLAAYPVQMGNDVTAMIRPPAMDISAVRQINCDLWSGSGFLIGDRIMATANHVMEGGTNCVDVATGTPLTVYKTDKAHDLTLVTGPDLPTDIPYVKTSCEPFHADEKYLAYGITGYGQMEDIVRNNVITATDYYTGPSFKFNDNMPVVHARIFMGYEAPGMSGGPITDINGYAHGLVTGGSAYMSFHYEFAEGILCGK